MPIAAKVASSAVDHHVTVRPGGPAPGIPIDGAEVEACAESPGIGLAATGITYRAHIHSPAPVENIRRLLRQTEADAEVQNTLRAGVPVHLVDDGAHGERR